MITVRQGKRRRFVENTHARNKNTPRPSSETSWGMGAHPMQPNASTPMQIRANPTAFVLFLISTPHHRALMNAGPDLVLACPHCGALARLFTLSSASPIGAVSWTDGYQEA